MQVKVNIKMKRAEQWEAGSTVATDGSGYEMARFGP